MGVTLWHFVEAEDGTMRRVPATRAAAFATRKAPWDRSGPGEVRMVQVGLVVERRSVVRFVVAWCPRYLLDEDGMLDAEHQRDGMHLAAGMIDWSTPEEGVVRLGPRIAKRDYQARHAWRPSNEQLHEVASAINRAAPHPPVVAVTAEGLWAV